MSSKSRAEAMMTDQRPQTQPERSRPIPDGGLAASGLPDWMQTRPEWSVRPAAPDMTVVNERVLPAPDVSSIDLASLLSADDLPDWLREVAERSATPDTERKVQSTTGEQAVEAVRSHAESESEIEANSVTQPWWTSDRIMAGLLIAVVLTILFVLITTIRLG